MNGRIAQSTRKSRRFFRSRTLPSRNLRTLLLGLCCAMSLAMLGAVRLAPQFRPDPLLAVSQSPIAEWNDARDADAGETPVGALNAPARPAVTGPAFPAGTELLRASAAPKPAAAQAAAQVVAPSMPFTPGTPRLVIPEPRKILMEVTAYCPCPRCCGPRAQGITASGRRVSYNGGKFVAADTRLLKFNTKLRIPGYANNTPVEVIDRGGAIKGQKLDVYFPTHQEARKWGRQKLWVTVVE